MLREYLGEYRSFRHDIKLFLLYNLFSNVGVGVFFLIFNLYLIEVGLFEDFIGIYNAVSTIALAGFAIMMGTLINRFGTWRCMTYGTMGFLITSVGLALSSQPWLILGFGILSGAATAFLITPIMPFVMEWARPENRLTVSTLAFSVNSLSMTLGSLIGGWSPRLFSFLIDSEIESVLTFRLTMLAGVAISALSLIPMYRMTQARFGSASETGQFAFVTDLPYTRAKVRADIRVFVGATFLFALGIGAVAPFYNVFLSSIGTRPSQIGMIFSIAGLVAAGVGLFAPSIANRVGPLQALFFVRTISVPAFLLLMLFPSALLGMVAHVVRTTTLSMSWPIDSTFVGELLPPRVRAVVFSYRSGAWNFGYALAALAAGSLIVMYGYGVTFIAFAVFSVVSSLVFWNHFRHRRDVEEVEVPQILETESEYTAAN